MLFWTHCPTSPGRYMVAQKILPLKEKRWPLWMKEGCRTTPLFTLHCQHFLSCNPAHMLFLGAGGCFYRGMEGVVCGVRGGIFLSYTAECNSNTSTASHLPLTASSFETKAKQQNPLLYRGRHYATLTTQSPHRGHRLSFREGSRPGVQNFSCEA